MSWKKKFGEIVADERRKKGWSQEELAFQLHARTATVSHWEQGISAPSFETMVHLCQMFGCDLDYLTGRLDKPTHNIKFIHDMTGLSVNAIKKLISLKDTGTDELISDLLTDKDSDKLISSIKMDIDEAEMWWNGLLENKTNDPFNSHRDVADFIASQSFLKVINNQRTRFEKANGRLYDRMVSVMLEKDRLEAVLSLTEKCVTDNEARNWLKDHYSVSKTNDIITDEEREEIIRLWHETKYDDLKKISFSEWRRKYGRN